ncbi:hypothetical protein PHMEG_00030711 [Phytophthora megakarya]|uniref:SH3 domain-containing protein n=1 Tax=Phytophthora megakarya TaxID=4795 RepID=A0A225UZE9_9STRA|nr:hypothetical protein PHMEG_00030711 [Phytophthora megakarya]
MEARRNWNMQVTALYDYEPEQLDELGFQEGDVLRVLYVQDDGWWSGYNVEIPNVVGLFPSNYVQAPRTTSPKRLVDAQTTPRPPASSRNRIPQQPRQAPETPEFDDEDDDEDEQDLREYRGHVGAVQQLRKSLEEAERASEAARDARRQAERERLRHRKSWREREQSEEDVEENAVDQDEPLDEGEDEDESESVFPLLQGEMYESDRQQTADTETDTNPNVNEENEIQDQTAETENAAASMISRRYRHHLAIVEKDREREREPEQQKLSKIAAASIQHAYLRHCKRRQRELEQNTARRRLKRRVEAATVIQKWIRLRWSTFWCRRVKIDREEQAAQEVAREKNRQAELEEKRRLEAAREEEQHRLAKEEELNRMKADEDEKHRVLEEKLKNEEQLPPEEEPDQHENGRMKADEEEKHRVLEEKLKDEEQLPPEEEPDQHENGSAVPSQNPQTPSPGKPRRKIMKKEAVELIKTLVQQQLGDTLRDQDSKMDELQRMVVRLQTVVRKQTVMLQDSTDQLVNMQMRKQEQSLLLRLGCVHLDP